MNHLVSLSDYRVIRSTAVPLEGKLGPGITASILIMQTSQQASIFTVNGSVHRFKTQIEENFTTFHTHICKVRGTIRVQSKIKPVSVKVRTPRVCKK